MTHKHKWQISSWRVICISDVNCDERMTLEEAERRLNEYETLKKAVECLSAEDAKELSDELQHFYYGFDTRAEMLGIYAKTLRGG